MLANASHDLAITNTDSVVLGFMLAKDSKGRVKYTKKSAAPLNILQQSGHLSPDAQNPDYLYPVAYQDSWIGGYGSYFYDPKQPRRYYATYGVDCSEDGLMKLGPDWTAINWPTVTAYDTFANLDMETWASATDAGSWTEALGNTGTVTRTTTVHGGTYAADLTSTGTTAGHYARMRQSGTWGSDLQGKKIRVTVWARGYTGTPKIQIYDGVGTASTTIGGTGSFSKYTVERTLDASATELTIICDCTGTGGAASRAIYDDIAIIGYEKSASYNAYAEYNGLQYLSAGDILYKANTASAPTSWTYVDNFKADITALFVGQVSGTSYLFIMIGSGNTSYDKGWYYDGSTVTQMTNGGSGTDASGDYTVTAGTTFYLAGRPTTVTTGAKCALRTNTSPLTGAWSADTIVGDPNTSITGLLNVNGVVYIPKEDSLWKVNSDGTVSQVVDYRFLYASTSGKNTAGWNGKLYIPCGKNSLIEYDPDSGTYSDISPAATITTTTAAAAAMAGALLSSAQSDFDGRIMAVAGGNEWLWAIQDNGSANNLFKGRYANVDGTIGWIWHPVAQTTMADVNALAVSALTTNYSVWAAHGTGNPGYYNLGTYEISGSPYLLTPYYTGIWDMIEALYKITLGLESVDSNVYVTVQPQFYGGNQATAITFDSPTSGVESNYVAANSYGTAVRFRINFVSNSATSTPKVTRLNGQGKIKASEVTIYDFIVTLADNQRGKNGAPDGKLASAKKTCLDNVRASNWPVTMYDIDGNTVTVDILDRQEVGRVQEYGKKPVLNYRVIAHKVTLS